MKLKQNWNQIKSPLQKLSRKSKLKREKIEHFPPAQILRIRNEKTIRIYFSFRQKNFFSNSVKKFFFKFREKFFIKFREKVIAKSYRKVLSNSVKKIFYQIPSKNQVFIIKKHFFKIWKSSELQEKTKKEKEKKRKKSKKRNEMQLIIDFPDFWVKGAENFWNQPQMF